MKKKTKKSPKSKATKRSTKRPTKKISLSALSGTVNTIVKKLNKLASGVTIEERPTSSEPTSSARESMKSELLTKLEEALKGVPDNARGVGMAVIIENNEVKTVSYETKGDALKLIERAKKNEISLVF